MGLFTDLVSPTNADLKAIDDYVSRLKSDSKTTAAAQKLITDYLQWESNRGAVDWLFDGDTLDEAKRRRDAIDAANNAPRTYNPETSGQGVKASFTLSDPSLPPPAAGLVSAARLVAEDPGEAAKRATPALGIGLAAIAAGAVVVLLLLRPRL